jgi:hypothetical protein
MAMHKETAAVKVAGSHGSTPAGLTRSEGRISAESPPPEPVGGQNHISTARAILLGDRRAEEPEKLVRNVNALDLLGRPPPPPIVCIVVSAIIAAPRVARCNRRSDDCYTA